MSKQNELLESDNKCSTNIEKLQKYVYLYDLMYDKITKLLQENYMNEEFQNQTFLPKDLYPGKCKCFNSRHSCFTGLCLDCNKQK